MPPFTSSTCPVMKLASSLARNLMAFATSAAVPIRRNGVRMPIEEATAHGAKKDWAKVGAANIRFHRGIVGLAGSRRLSEESDRLFAELMLAFRVVSDPKRLHMAYLPLNREIVELLNAGDVDGAIGKLRAYFDLAEADLVEQLEAD